MRGLAFLMLFWNHLNLAPSQVRVYLGTPWPRLGRWPEFVRSLWIVFVDDPIFAGTLFPGVWGALFKSKPPIPGKMVLQIFGTAEEEIHGHGLWSWRPAFNLKKIQPKPPVSGKLMFASKRRGNSGSSSR